MSGARRRLTWLPPFVLGVAGALAAELAAALLLYSAEGLVRALSVVLATEAGAFGLGLWSSRRGSDLEVIRRRWLLTLVVFTAAAGFSVVWGSTGGFSAASLSQGLGLGLLGGLPLYGVGAVLGSLEPSEAAPGEVPGGSAGAAAALGAAVGLVAGGLYLIPRFHPTSLLLLCVVLLSGSAVVHGWLLDGRLMIRSVFEGPSAIGPIRIEERSRGAPRAAGRVLLVGGRPASARSREGGGPVLPWAVALAELVGRRWPGGARAALVGVGLGELRGVGRGPSGGGVAAAVEPRPGVARAVEAAGAPGEGRWEAPVGEGEPERALVTAGGSFDVGVVALRLLTGDPTRASLPAGLPALLLERAAPGGLVAVGGLDLSGGEPDELLDAVSADPGGREVRLALYRPQGPPPGLLGPGEGRGGGLLLAGVDPAEPWPAELGGLARIAVRTVGRASPGEEVGASEPHP